VSVHGEFHRYREALLECVRAHPGPEQAAWIALLEEAAPSDSAPLSELAELVLRGLPDVAPPAARAERERFTDLRDGLVAVARIIRG